MNNLPKLKKHNGIYVVSSRVIANELGKRYDHIIRDIEKILENPNVGSLIIPSLYRTSNQIRTYKEYLLTKDGFTLYMFNIQGYNDFKLAYINEFNRMEQALNNQTLPFKKEKNEDKILKVKPFNDKYYSEMYECMQKAYNIESRIEKIYNEELLPLYNRIEKLNEIKRDCMISLFNGMKYGNILGKK